MLRSRPSLPLVAAAFIAFLLVTSTLAQDPGQLDANFGNGGVLKVELPYAHDPASLQMAMTPASAGRFLAVFLYRPSAAEPAWSLATCRITPAGAVDTTYGTDGFTAFTLSRTGTLQLKSALFHTGDSTAFVAVNEADDAVVVGLNSTGSKRTSFGTQGELTLVGAVINGLYEEFRPLPLGGSLPKIGVFGSRISAGSRQAFWYRQATSGTISQGTLEFVATADLAALYGPADPSTLHSSIHCVTTRADGVRLLIGSAEQVAGHPIGLFAKPVPADSTLSTAQLRPIYVPLAPGRTPHSINWDAVGELVLHLNQDDGSTAARLRRSGAVDETCPLPASLFPSLAGPELQQNTLLCAYTHRGSRYAQVRQQQRLDGGWQVELLRFDWTGQPDLSLNGSGKITVALPGLSAISGAFPSSSQHLLAYGKDSTDLATPRLVVLKLWQDSAPIVWTNLQITHATPELSLPPAGSGNFEITASNPDGLPSSAIRYYFRNQNGQLSDSSLIGSFPQQHDGSRGSPHPRVRQHTLFASDGERAAQRNVLLIMQQPPFLLEPIPTDQSKVVGTPLWISPRMSGASPFEFTWTKVNPSNGLQTPVNSSLIHPHSAELHIPKLKKSDAGIYRFQFSNIDGISAVFDFKVEVLNNPTLDEISGSQLVAAGSDGPLWIRLLTNESQVTVRWTKNGTSIGSPKKEWGRTIDSSLILFPVKPSDAGVYRASARTAQGSLLTPAMHLAVVATPAPVQYAVAGRRSTLQAAVYGGQNLIHQWLRNGQVLQDSERHRGATTTRLIFNSPTPADSGPYIFRTIGYGSQIDREIELIVVIQAPQGTTVALPPAKVGSVYAAQLDFLHHAARHRITGLPPGLRLDPITGAISGIPERRGSFPLVAWAENPAGRSPSINLTLEVSAFPSHLAGEYRKSGGFPFNASLGAFQFQVSNHGSLSGILPLHGNRFAVRGRLIELPDLPGVYEAELHTRNNARSLEIWAPALKVRITGTHLDLHLQEPGPNLFNGPFPGKFCPPRDNSPLAATYHLAGTATSAPHVSLHGDHSYARVTVNAKGQTRWTGRLSDGRALTGSAQLNVQDAITMHWFYGPGGTYFGLRDLTFTQPTAPAPLQASGTAQWRPSMSDITQSWQGTAYTQPTFGPDSQLLLGAQPGPDNLSASLSSIHYGNRSVRATLTANHRAATGLVTAPNLDRLSNLILNPRTGLFSGTWIWDDTAVDPPTSALPAKGGRIRLPIRGLIVQQPQQNQPLGYGFALLPALTTTSEGGTTREIIVKRPAALLLAPAHP